MRYVSIFLCFIAFFLLLPNLSFAHEVYVLDPSTIASDIASYSPNPFGAFWNNEFRFFFWGFISFIVFSTILCASIFHVFEHRLVPLFFYLKRFAHPVVRLTCGVCLIACGLYSALFGPELPFSHIFRTGAEFMHYIFIGAGVLTILGIYTRAVAALMLGISLYAVLAIGPYILTYANYLGEFVLLFLLGSGAWSLDTLFSTGKLPKRIRIHAHRFEPLAFPLLRILFGFAIMYASIYAKFIHSNLALDVVNQYHLTTFFPFRSSVYSSRSTHH
jgi:hypothetical protein